MYTNPTATTDPQSAPNSLGTRDALSAAVFAATYVRATAIESG